MSEVNKEVEAIKSEIEMLDTSKKLTTHQVAEKLNEVINKLNSVKVRDRGPKSEREMTEVDAIRLIEGDMKDVAHKSAAEKLGLSYGQVYSARLGYTFKHIYRRNNR